MTIVETSLQPDAAAQAPSSAVARGFALYVGVSEAEAASCGLSLAELASELRTRLAELIPNADDVTYAAVALAPQKQSGKNLDLVRIALREPKAIAQLGPAFHTSKPQPDQNQPGYGVVVDLTRKRLFLDGQKVVPTCKEFALLAYLISNTGRAVAREELWQALGSCPGPAGTRRAIDVHVRRLRAKLPGYEDVVSTVRGVGYRFDSNPEVLVEQL